MSSTIRRFLGGPPGWVLVRLLIISLVVGVVLSALNIHPLDILVRLERMIRGLWDMGLESLLMAGRWLLMGALVVIPIWLVLRILNIGRRGP